jgi:hypothetical protein
VKFIIDFGPSALIAIVLGLIQATLVQGQSRGPQPIRPDSIHAALRARASEDTVFDVQRYVEDYYIDFCIDTTGPEPVIDISFQCDSLCLYQHPELGLSKIGWMFGSGHADMPVRNIPKLHLIPCIQWWHPSQRLAHDDPIPLMREFRKGDSSGFGAARLINPSAYAVRIRLIACSNSSVDSSILHRIVVASAGLIEVGRLAPGTDTKVARIPVGLYRCETVELELIDSTSSPEPAKRCERTVIERIEIRGGLVSKVVVANTDPNAALYGKTDTVGVCRFWWLEQFEMPPNKEFQIGE